MLADLNLALRDPHALIQSLYEQTEPCTLDGFERRVEQTFKELFKDAPALAQLPLVDSSSTQGSLPAAGTLVRFRAMVQDTGLGTEVFQALNKQGQVLLFGKEDLADPTTLERDDYSDLRERQAFFAVSVPAETQWTKEKSRKRDAIALDSQVAGLSLDSKPEPDYLARKYPLPNEPHVSMTLKLYGDMSDSLKITDVFDFIGILGTASIPVGLEDPTADSAATEVTVPALHTVAYLPTARLPLSEQVQNCSSLRNEVLDYLAGGLGGDKEAAEWTLLALLTRIHTRHATGVALGCMSLNLALPSDFNTNLNTIIASLTPRFAEVDLSIPMLNNQKTRVAPRNRDENLESGWLQLPSGTRCLIDMRGITEGKLDDNGVRNLRHFATTVAQQKVSYEFPFSSFDLETDLGFILLSEGKAILPADCVVYVSPESGHVAPETPSETKLDQFRSFIERMRSSEFTIPEEMSEVIQSDFVERRQKSVGGGGMSQEDLLFRMTAARLVALSNGKTALSKEAWLHTAELDERRKDNFPEPVKAANASNDKA